MELNEQSEMLSSAPADPAEVGRTPSAPSSRTTKAVAVTRLLSRNKGATLGEIMAITHWQPHSSRAFLTGLRKKGVRLLRETRRDGETSYRIER